MKPTPQTIFGSDGYDGAMPGNCMSACIASILEIDLQEIPHFRLLEQQTSRCWNAILNDWLEPRGLAFLLMPAVPAMRHQLMFCPSYHMMLGNGPRGHRHGVVGLKGQLAHDPHPDGTGLLDVDYFGVFVPR